MLELFARCIRESREENLHMMSHLARSLQSGLNDQRRAFVQALSAFPTEAVVAQMMERAISNLEPHSVTAGNSGRNTTPERLPPRPSKSRKYQQDKYSGHPQRPKFLVCVTLPCQVRTPDLLLTQEAIRRHLKILLKVDSLSYAALRGPNVFQPPTDEELTAYADREVGCVSTSSTNFRVDFSRPLTSDFNREAIDVFAEDFLNKIQRQEWYSQYRIPPEFLNKNYLRLNIHQHLEYVATVWKTPHEEFQGKFKANARRNRKSTVSLLTAASPFLTDVV
jgi:hypothetical protein